MLLVLGIDGRSVYEEEFEIPFLKIIVEDFKRETRDQYLKTIFAMMELSWDLQSVLQEDLFVLAT